MPQEPTILWFRDDLRVADNRALTAAAEAGGPVCAVYVLDEGSGGVRPLGGASRWWLHHSLAALGAELKGLGTPLHIFRGPASRVVPALAKALDAARVFWSRRYGGPERQIDAEIKSSLTAGGIEAKSFNDRLLAEPWEVKTKSGESFRVFTPFWRALQALSDPSPVVGKPNGLKPARLPRDLEPAAVPLRVLGLLPTNPDWAGGLRETWTPGEPGARKRLAEFLRSDLAGYADRRDRPDLDATSHLSPHLRFGEVSARQVWHAARRAGDEGRAEHREKFLSELGWREFSYHLLFHHADLATHNFQPRFDAFPWAKDAKGTRAWQRGRTGMPIIDAGMRQLWQTGWMHNRVRMIAASFLVKHLRVDWRVGEAWFWDTLVDADPANNAASWQWVAGSGADAAPYFRIFNPVLQGEKFDPDGDYVRRFVPELARLPASHIHKPWEAPAQVLEAAGIALGKEYPRPIVDLAEGRARALAAFERTK
jgi:deoxyribodipyrimidine photo-lyase